jgi:coenzyme F420-0:L-glutamate ligase/coenzyme F420-1:gamma-L-glutamate ligase
MSRVEAIGLKIPIIEGKCDLVNEILKAAAESNIKILDRDVIVVTDKVVSKCFGRLVNVKLVNVKDVKVSEKALKLAKKTRLDPKFVELVLENSDEIVAVVPIKRLVEKGLVELRSQARDTGAAERLLEEYPVFFLTLSTAEAGRFSVC